MAIPHQPLTNVRLAPNSGHKWLGRGMSAFDPKRTLTTLGGFEGGVLTVQPDEHVGGAVDVDSAHPPDPFNPRRSPTRAAFGSTRADRGKYRRSLQGKAKES